MTDRQRFATVVGAAIALALLGACSDRGPPEGWLGEVESVDNPAAEGSRYPSLAARAGGPSVLSWLQPLADGRHALRYSAWSDGAWGVVGTVASGEDWFVNWADFPSVVPIDATHWAAHWLQKTSGNAYSYDVRLAVSRDAGASWSAPMSPHDDGTPTEHGFVSLYGLGGVVQAVWLDGRHTAGEAQHAGHAHGGEAGAMTLRGAAIGPDGRREGGDGEIDGRVCDCCQTDVAVTADGPVVVYRDRGEVELRDIALVRQEAGRWSAPVRVHDDGWKIDACPVNGPAVDARGNTVAVAWFTAPDRSRVRVAFSRDAGRSFDPPVEVASGNVTGRVDLVLLEDGRAVVSWLQSTTAGAEIRAQPFTTKGHAGPSVLIASSDVQRSSGFPQMVRDGDELLFAWTESGDPTRVRTARARLH
jgi:hypothetical protein